MMMRLSLNIDNEREREGEVPAPAPPQSFQLVEHRQDDVAVMRPQPSTTSKVISKHTTRSRFQSASLPPYVVKRHTNDKKRMHYYHQQIANPEQDQVLYTE